MSHSVPILIIGAGLAGCLLAWRLEQRGLSCQLIGCAKRPNASEVAAGVINPVTGRWMTKTWRIDTLLPEAESLYRQLESRFGVTLYHPTPLFRYCQNSSDAKRLGRRMRNPRYSNVLGSFIPPGDGPDAILDAHGSFQILHTAYVDLPLLLKTLRQHFGARGQYRDEDFAYNDLKPAATSDHEWSYRNQTFGHVIFCEGAGILNNPWFGELPLTPAKGETLLLESPTLDLPRAIYHHRKWILPYGDQTFRIGATFDETDLTEQPTEQGHAELFEAARAFIAPQHALHLRQQLAGIRPCTVDSRPLIGTHPTKPGLHVFNGLGSKGASLAPAMSRHFLGYLLDGAPLDPEVGIARFNHI